MINDALSAGSLAEAKVNAELLECGIISTVVEVPAPYDLVADIDGDLKKVQVKSCSLRDEQIGDKGSYQVDFRKNGRVYEDSVYHNRHETYTGDEVDYFAIYNPDYDEVYWLPFDETPDTATSRMLKSWREYELTERFK